jgi:hypothetical protein
VGGGESTGAIEGQTLTLGSTATPTNAADAIVGRDGMGSFEARSVGLSDNLDPPHAASGSVGLVTMGGTRFLQNYGTGT